MFQDLFNIESCGLYSDKVRKLRFQRSGKIKTKKHHWTTESSYLILLSPYYNISGGFAFFMKAAFFQDFIHGLFFSGL